MAVIALEAAGEGLAFLLGVAWGGMLVISADRIKRKARR